MLKLYVCMYVDYAEINATNGTVILFLEHSIVAHARPCNCVTQVENCVFLSMSVQVFCDITKPVSTIIQCSLYNLCLNILEYHYR